MYKIEKLEARKLYSIYKNIFCNMRIIYIIATHTHTTII